MHDIWNPWHGCIKKSEGCENCYMYYLDYKHGKMVQIYTNLIITFIILLRKS